MGGCTFCMAVLEGREGLADTHPRGRVPTHDDFLHLVLAGDLDGTYGLPHLGHVTQPEIASLGTVEHQALEILPGGDFPLRYHHADVVEFVSLAVAGGDGAAHQGSGGRCHIGDRNPQFGGARPVHHESGIPVWSCPWKRRRS